MTELIITKPDDMHLHLREGEMLKAVIHHTANQFSRAIVMPNLSDPITTVEKAQNYFDQIKSFYPNFSPLMTIYFSDQLNDEELLKIRDSSIIIGIKLYPSGVTTNSDRGVNSINDCFHIFEAMEKNDIPLLIHGEVNDPDVDIFDREKVFIDRHLVKITKQFPNLRVVFEHISTKDAVEFVIDGIETLAATITPQHIMMNRNHLLSGGIKPHNYCLPVLKRSSHQKSVLEAALSGNPKFFLGTDSAPHLKNQKENACGCAGVYSAPYAMPMYAQIFDQNNALEKLEPFASFYGADFYKLPRNSTKLKLIKEKTQVSQSIKINNQEVIPYLAGCELDWQIVSN